MFKLVVSQVPGQAGLAPPSRSPGTRPFTNRATRRLILLILSARFHQVREFRPLFTSRYVISTWFPTCMHQMTLRHADWSTDAFSIVRSLQLKVVVIKLCPGKTLNPGHGKSPLCSIYRRRETRKCITFGYLWTILKI